MSRFVPGFQVPAMAAADALWLVFHAADSVVLPAQADGLLLDAEQASRLCNESANALYLGTFDDKPCFACELDEAQAPAADAWQVRPLRDMLRGLADDEMALAATARQLLHWRITHRFCGCCGTPMQDKQDERARLCPACGHLVFPRINPAVIVAVRRGDELLLGRNNRYRSRSMFSLIAGFVEVGESLEQTVQREVMEEVGLIIRDITYFGSQPWPFPSTLMLGFTAEYAGGEICLHDQELAEAGWFKASALPEIPRPGSISRTLIDAFIARVGKGS